MSLSFEGFLAAIEEWEKVNKRLNKLLGFNPSVSNHYGVIQIYNRRINSKTSDEEILKIRIKYLEWKFNKKDLKFRMKMLLTSIFNSSDMSSKYENLTKIGFSRFLPMVALGHTQKEVISMAKLEQQIMQLDAYMLPPFSSNTMSSDTWSDIKAQQQQILSGGKVTPVGGQADTARSGSVTSDSDGGAGRPQLPNDKKSDKTIANQAAQN